MDDQINLRIRAFLDRLKLRLWRIFSNNEGLMWWIYKIGGDKYVIDHLANSLDLTGYQPGRPTVLCIARNLFWRDIEQLRQRTDFNWINLSSYLLARAQIPLVPVEMRQQLLYVAYNGDDRDDILKRIELFAEKLLKKIEKEIKISAVMSANIDYWQDEGFRLICPKHNIPFLSLCREHQLWGGEYFVGNYYRKLKFRYSGSGVAVFGEQTAKALVETGSCTSDQVWVTGPPRLDKWRDSVYHSQQKNKITLLSYSDPDYLAGDNFIDVLKVFVRTSISNKDGKISSRFIIKCKDKKDYHRVQNILRNTPHNLELLIDIPLEMLLAQSKLVVGFNTMALLEGLFTNATLAVPHWGDIKKQPLENLMFNPTDHTLHQAFSFLYNEDELELLINRAVTGDIDQRSNSEERFNLLQRFFYFPKDGSCSLQVARFVRHFIDSSSQAIN